MRCLYCDRNIDMPSLTSIYLQTDLLCRQCRSKIIKDHKYLDIDDLKVESFYLYDGMFKNLLIQYKECFDEALAPVFLYMLEDYIRFKYIGYTLVFVPSSDLKMKMRGFNQIEKIFENVRMGKQNCLFLKQQLIQEGKNYAQRGLMKDNYEYRGKPLNKALIVDDVCTSGSSIYGAYKALKPYCRQIKALSLAHTKTLSF